MRKFTAAGRVGTGIRVGAEWTGWAGPVAHPSAPLGGGGPGNFGRPRTVDGGGSDLGNPWSPGPLGAEPMDQPATKPKAPNPPPVTVAKKLDVVKEQASEFVDYKVEAEILADGKGGVTEGAETSFNRVKATTPKYESDAEGKITKFKGKVKFKGTIQIQTKYASGAKATDLSCYGRGTTKDDIQNGDVSLGFHESCHRADYAAYLKANALPEPPAMKIGMDATDYETAANEFNQAVLDYWQAMTDDSIQKTDQVGHTLDTVNQSGNCYVHNLP